MKNLHNYICLSLIPAVITCIAGCKGSSSDKLTTASQLVNERPDSAYTILRDIDYDDLDSDSLKAKYILTKALTNIRIGRSLITDTLLNDAAAYYISVGDTANWVNASHLLAGYDFMRGDSESALQRLIDLASRLKNQKLLWDTYIHLLEVSINSQNYTPAYNYADWLLNHTNVPEQTLRFATAKGVAQYQQGNFAEARTIFDSIIATGVTNRVNPKISADFYCDYAEILDGAGYSSKAISIIDSLNRNGEAIDKFEEISRMFALAQFYANSGNTGKAKELLDKMSHSGTQSIFEIYASIAMLKAALQFKESGRFPSELMHEVTKNMQRNYQFAQFDRQTAMNAAIKLNDDNYELKLQRQRLWMLISSIAFLLVVSGVIVYFILNRRKQRMIEAEERAETLAHMLKDYKRNTACSSDSDKLKAALLRQLGIFKTFAGAPTPQSRDALKKISAINNNGTSIESLVDWTEFYRMIDTLYDGFHAKLIKKYPDAFNDKEQQIIVLLKAGFSTKEIGVLTEQSSATIYTRKSVIRKKLGTSENGDFIAQLDAQIKDI